MKYNIGDVIQIKRYEQNESILFQNRVGIILAIEINEPNHAYQVLIAGAEGKRFFLYEEEIEQKLE